MHFYTERHINIVPLVWPQLGEKKCRNRVLYIYIFFFLCKIMKLNHGLSKDSKGSCHLNVTEVEEL